MQTYDQAPGVWGGSLFCAHAHDKDSGGSKTLSVNLKPGTYTFFCEVPGHRQAGMYGTLTVK